LATTSQNGPSREWLEAFRRGDREHLQAIFLEHALRLRRMLRQGFTVSSEGSPAGRFVGLKSYFELDCAIQEIFRRAFEFKTRASYDGRVSFGTYLNAIARNYALNTLRSREVPSDPVDVASCVNGAAENRPPSPEERVQQKELHDAVAAFRESCCEEERAVLACRYEEGLSQAQAAEKLGKTRRRIRTVENHLRRKLVRLLRDHGPEGKEG
jgi:RNA polymerase sigma-70 factor (ECF subfamily)